MGTIDPGPYIITYCIIVFGIPFLVQASFAVRLIARLFKLGIDPFSIDWLFRQKEMFEDPIAAKLYNRAMSFFPIILFTYVLGVVILIVIANKFGGPG